MLSASAVRRAVLHGRRHPHRHRHRAGRAVDHQVQGRPGDLVDHRVPVPRTRLRRGLRRHRRRDHRRLRFDHGRGRVADRVRRSDRIPAAFSGYLPQAGGRTAADRRPPPAALCDDGRALHRLPLDLCRCPGRSGVPDRPFLGTTHRIPGPGPHGRCHRHRHLRGLRLRHPRPRRGLHRRLAEHPARHLALVRDHSRSVDRRRDDDRVRPDGADALLESRQGRRPGGRS